MSEPAWVPLGGATTPLRENLNIVAQTITDWNNATQNGYYMGSGAANAPTPGVWYIGEVVTHRDFSPAYITQRAWDFTAGMQSQIYERRCISDVWGSWYAIPAGYGTALPSGITDGYEFTLVDSLSAPTYSWRFRYVAAKATNKWVFVGGAPRFQEVVTAESITTSAFSALATAGPSFALPVAGDYEIGMGFETGGANRPHVMSVDIGGTVATDANGVQGGAGNTGAPNSLARTQVKTGLAAVTITAKYRADGTNAATFLKRWLRIQPIAVGG